MTEQEMLKLKKMASDKQQFAMVDPFVLTKFIERYEAMEELLTDIAPAWLPVQMREKKFKILGPM